VATACRCAWDGAGTGGDGKTTDCETVFVGTGGHRLAPGFQRRAFPAGTKAEPKTQAIYVECKGADVGPGSELSLDYSYVTGEYNYYDQQANKASGKMEVSLDPVVKDVAYPIAAPVEGLTRLRFDSSAGVPGTATELLLPPLPAQGVPILASDRAPEPKRHRGSGLWPSFFIPEPEKTLLQ